MEYGHGIYCRCVAVNQPCCQYLSEMDIFSKENASLVDELVDLKAEKDVLERKEKAIRLKLMERMQEHHIDSFETDTAKVAYVEDSNYRKVDSEKLRSKYPSAYHACCTYGYKDSYLILRVKK